MTPDRRVVPFRWWHYGWLQEKCAAIDALGCTEITPSVARHLERENTWTGVVDGNIVAIAGTMKQWEGRHIAWAYMGDQTGPHMLWITREVLAALGRVQGRIELTVRADLAVGHRWAKTLGFAIENPPGLLKKFGPMGEDHVAYVRSG